MAAPAPAPRRTELIVHRFGKEFRTPLELERYRLGRSASNELSFPEDTRLSREHLVFERSGGGWSVRDLRSSNGTRVNGEKISTQTLLLDGDEVVAGGLTLVFRTAEFDRQQTIVAFHNEPATDPHPAFSMDLEDALNSGIGSGGPNGGHVSALLQAGRELARYRTLDELFTLILELSVNAVRASRGVLMLLENGTLTPRSSQGEFFRISKTVRDRVLGGESLLVEDTLVNEQLARSDSLIASHVRSVLAVPLQSDRGVLGLIYLDSLDRIRHFTADDLSLLTVMANIAGIRIEHARLLEVEQMERQLTRELDQAAEIQKRLLPTTAPCSDCLDIAGFNGQCRKVGGDYYDFWGYPNGSVAVVIGDVSGKGMPAALLMANLQASAHVLFEESDDLARRVSKLNRAVATNTPMSSFITFFAGIIDPERGTLTYCNAGHNQPILLRASGECERLEATGMVLGILADAPYGQSECAFTEGDRLLMFSDGVSEACQGDSNEEFGEERLIEVLRRTKAASAVEVIEEIRSELASFVAGAPQGDDVTLVVALRSVASPA